MRRALRDGRRAARRRGPRGRGGGGLPALHVRLLGAVLRGGGWFALRTAAGVDRAGDQRRPARARRRARPRGRPAHARRPDRGAARRRVIVTFLSDYGPGDEYVGIVHGVIATIAPQARIIDLGHGVPPQDVRTGSRRLARALPFTPPGIHLAVVDPGVGTTRRAVALRTPRPHLRRARQRPAVPGRQRRHRGARDHATRRTGSTAVSATFHGRDIFGPVAAHLAERGAVRPGGHRDRPGRRSCDCPFWRRARVSSTSWRSTASGTSSPTACCRRGTGSGSAGTTCGSGGRSGTWRWARSCSTRTRRVISRWPSTAAAPRRGWTCRAGDELRLEPLL